MNSVRVRLLTTVPHLHFPLGFAHLGDEVSGTVSTVRFGDGVVHDIHSEQFHPTMRAMIHGAARHAVKVWRDKERLRRLAETHPGIMSLPPDDVQGLLDMLGGEGA
jgi:hypothetical protein